MDDWQQKPNSSGTVELAIYIGMNLLFVAGLVFWGITAGGTR